MTTDHDDEIVRNPDGTYMTNEQVAEHVYKELKPVDIELIKTIPEPDGMYRFHFGTGMHMRNRYGMWREDNPHSVLDPVDHAQFPDQRSHEVLKMLWKKINVQ